MMRGNRLQRYKNFSYWKNFCIREAARTFLFVSKKRGTDNKGRISNSRYLGSVTIS